MPVISSGVENCQDSNDPFRHLINDAIGKAGRPEPTYVSPVISEAVSQRIGGEAFYRSQNGAGEFCA